MKENDMEYTDFVSLHTASEIKRAIEQCGHTVEYIGNVYKLKERIEAGAPHPDLVFNIAEGFGSRNREALIPGFLEICHIPYTASDAYAMAVNLNKYHTKILAASIGVPVPKGICFKERNRSIVEQANAIGYPIVLKLNTEGGSMGVTLAGSEDEFIRKADRLIAQYHGEILAEEYIPGKEITVPIIGNGKEAKALGAVLLLHKNGDDISLYDCHMKGENSDITNSLTTGLPKEVEKLICDYSLSIHRFFDLRDYSRMDFRVTSDGYPYFLEINAMPSLGRDGSFELCGKAAGLQYYEVIGKIIEAAVNRYNLNVN